MFCFTKEIEYTYDVFGRRIAKSIDWDGEGANPAEEIQYIYDGFRSDRGNAGDHIILAFDGDDALTNRYLHGPDVDQVLADEQVPAGDLFWMLADNLGSVRDVVDSDGTVLNHIVYDSFGNVVSESDDTVDVIFGYTGRERDEESDLQYNRARFYDARVGRWISEDPIGFLGGDSNLNRYVGNGVTNYTDPSGLQPPKAKPKQPNMPKRERTLQEQADWIRDTVALVYARKWQELKWKEARLHERDLITSLIHDSLHTACWGETYAKQLRDEIEALEKEALEQQRVTYWMLVEASWFLQVTGQLTPPVPPKTGLPPDIATGGVSIVGGWRRLTAVAREIRSMVLKGWKKGKGGSHYVNHGTSMGFRNVSEYTDAAKALAAKCDDVIEGKVGNIIFKYDKTTEHILVINAKDRVIKTFYKADKGILSLKEAMKAHLDVINALP